HALRPKTGWRTEPSSRRCRTYGLRATSRTPLPRLTVRRLLPAMRAARPPPAGRVASADALTAALTGFIAVAMPLFSSFCRSLAPASFSFLERAASWSAPSATITAHLARRSIGRLRRTPRQSRRRAREARMLGRGGRWRIGTLVGGLAFSHRLVFAVVVEAERVQSEHNGIKRQ